MSNLIRSGINYPQRRHASMEDNLRIQVKENAQPGVGNLVIYASWDDRLEDLPLDSLFFTALNQRACILVSLSEDMIPDPEVITDLIKSRNIWILHFAAFLQAKHPILRANLAIPDNPSDPLWLEAPLDLSDGDVQDFCEAILADETIDLIIKHQSYADGQYTLAYSATGISHVLRKEIQSVVQKFKPELTREDFTAAYRLLQQVYSTGGKGLDRNKSIALELVSRARNRDIRFDPYETPEMREKREQKEEEEEMKREQQEIENYAKRLLGIKEVLDFGTGTAECKALGVEINEHWGFQGMVTVVDYIREHYDRVKARSIERAWDGIGEWQG